MNVPMLVAYQTAVPADARGNAMAVLNSAGYLSIALLSLALAGLSAGGLVSASGQLKAVGTIAAAGAGVAALLLFGPPLGLRAARNR